MKNRKRKESDTKTEGREYDNKDETPMKRET
jgi:hypothetical protein